MSARHPVNILREEDYKLARSIVGGYDRLLEPDVIIAPDGQPYLYRWHVIPRNADANVYFHVQVASDPERPLHDHPWDNVSVILAGGYDELLQAAPPFGHTIKVRRQKGDTIFRKADAAHRLILPEGTPYTMTLFTTGPTKRDWGFWIVDHRGQPMWRSHKECVVVTPEGRSMFVEPADAR